MKLFKQSVRQAIGTYFRALLANAHFEKRCVAELAGVNEAMLSRILSEQDYSVSNEILLRFLSSPPLLHRDVRLVCQVFKALVTLIPHMHKLRSCGDHGDEPTPATIRAHFMDDEVDEAMSSIARYVRGARFNALLERAGRFERAVREELCHVLYVLGYMHQTLHELDQSVACFAFVLDHPEADHDIIRKCYTNCLTSHVARRDHHGFAQSERAYCVESLGLELTEDERRYVRYQRAILWSYQLEDLGRAPLREDVEAHVAWLGHGPFDDHHYERRVRGATTGAVLLAQKVGARPLKDHGAHIAQIEALLATAKRHLEAYEVDADFFFPDAKIWFHLDSARVAMKLAHANVPGYTMARVRRQLALAQAEFEQFEGVDSGRKARVFMRTFMQLRTHLGEHDAMPAA